MSQHDFLNLTAIKTACPAWRIDYHQELPSTNRYAVEQAAHLDAPTLVLTEKQTSGKGRGDNLWWSADGSLTFSLVIDPQALWGEESLISLTSLVIAALVRKVIVENWPTIPQQQLQLKWPNDLYLQERKLCGILLEKPNRNRLVIGIGLNVNNSFADSPTDIKKNAISLIDLHQRIISRTRILSQLLTALTRLMENRELLRNYFTESWRQHHLLSHKLVTLQAGSEQISGRCEGVDDDGALLVRDMHQLHRIHSAVILDWQD